MIIKWRHDLKILFNSEGRWQPLLNAAQDDYMTVIIQVLTIACSCYFISSNTGILNSPKKLFLRCKPGRNRTGRKLTVDKIPGGTDLRNQPQTRVVTIQRIRVQVQTQMGCLLSNCTDFYAHAKSIWKSHFLKSCSFVLTCYWLSKIKSSKIVSFLKNFNVQYLFIS